MTREETTELFSHIYDREKWKNLLFHLFDTAVFQQKIYDIKTTAAQSNIAEHIYYLGDVRTSSNQQIGFYEVHLKPGRQIARNRVQLRNLIRQELGEGITDAALAIFIDKSQSEWRFSFISKWAEYNEQIGFERKETHPKRYTYILGPNQSVRTAVERFTKLSGKKSPTLHDLLEAFSVEKLSKEFFDHYEEHFEAFSKYVLEHYSKLFKSSINEDDSLFEIKARNWTKLLLGRIIFLYFLQKKGWMGAKDSDYTEVGDLDFLNNFWKGFDKKDHFYSHGLTELFFNTLNTKRTNDTFDKTESCVPYLNGGLFENHFESGNQIDFPTDYFQNLFDFLNSYNFTIDESNPDDKDVGIDPEMLGMVFERLIEDNRASGTYYTPKAIVQYMVQESLIEYLDFKMEAKHGEFIRPEIEKWIREKTFDDKLRKLSRSIDQEIDGLRMCDPAVGSGAFPMGVLQELVNLKSFLYPLQNDFYDIKKNIVQNSIFGVDIDKGAVDIAQLRFWLSLMIEDSKPRPLPNLELNIIQGNSLLQDDFESVRPWKRKDFKDWSDTKFRLFNEHDVPVKKELRKSLHKYQIDALTNHDRGIQLSTEQDASVLVDQETIIKEAKENYLSNGEKQSFVWNLFFPEVMKEGGFDIVLSNPPYVRQEKISYKNELKNYENYSGTTDLLVYFIELGSKLAKNNGNLCYIVSNKFMRAGYGKKIRGYLANHNLKKIIDFGDSPVFKATAYPSILLFQKKQSSGDVQVANVKGFSDTDLRAQLSPNIFSIPQVNLDSNCWMFTSKKSYRLLEKLSAIGTSLGEYVNDKIYRGIITGYNKAFVIDYITRKELIRANTGAEEIIKPFLRGKDIKSYEKVQPSNWLIYLPNGCTRKSFGSLNSEEALIRMTEKYPSVMNHLLKHEQALKNRDDQGEHWWELRPCQYYNEFEVAKIVYPNICKKPEFTLDINGNYTNQKCYIIPVHDLALLGYLNSSTMNFLFQNKLPKLRGDFYEPGKHLIRRFPMPTMKIKDSLPNLVKRVLTIEESSSRKAIEADINDIIYQLYDLNGEEIDIIEGRKVKKEKKKVRFTPFQPFQEKHLNQKREKRSEARAIVMARVIDLHNQSIFHETLHRTKGEKILHLIENHFDVDLGRIPWQDAAGPVDMVAINQTEAYGKREEYFLTKEVEFKPGKKRIDYSPGKKINEALVKYGKVINSQKAVDNLIMAMLPLTRKQSECIATLDSILHHISPEELNFKVICQKFYNWHESKKTFTHDEIREGLKWLKKQNLLPTWIKVKIWERDN